MVANQTLVSPPNRSEQTDDVSQSFMFDLILRRDVQLILSWFVCVDAFHDSHRHCFASVGQHERPITFVQIDR